MLEGKVIQIYDKLGYIQYNLDNKISFLVKDNPNVQIGQTVSFDLIEKKVPGREITFNLALNLTKIQSIRLNGKDGHSA